MRYAKWTGLCVLATTSVLVSVEASALTRAATPDGTRFASGGIGEAEIRALDAERSQYSLWVITAAKTSGAYLAGLHVKITDARMRTVFDRKIDGPWLLIDLPLGKYAVEATYKDQTQRKTTSIDKGDHHEMIFYYESSADVLPASPASGAR